MSSWTSLPAGVVGLGLDPQQLLAVVPLVQRLGLVEALVALQPHQVARPRYVDERLGQLRLADAGGALDEHRLAELGGQERDERRRLARQIADLREAAQDLGDGSGLRTGDAMWSKIGFGRGRVSCSPPRPPTVGVVIAILVVGSLIGVFGHIIKSRTLIITGILLIGLVSAYFSFVAQPGRAS